MMLKVFSLVTVMLAVLVSVSAQTVLEPKKAFQLESASLKIEGNSITQEEGDAAVVRETAYSYPADEFKPGVVKVGPRTTYLKEGLTRDEVVRLLGRPSAVSERSVQDLVTTILEFPRSEGQVLIAEFVKNKLVRATMEAREQVARSDR